MKEEQVEQWRKAARTLHMDINVVIHRQGGRSPACDGPDCEVCRKMLMCFADLAAAPSRSTPAPSRASVDGIREMIDLLLQERGVPILNFVRERDRDAAYQVGLMLDDLARALDINSPSLPHVPISPWFPDGEPAALPAVDATLTTQPLWKLSPRLEALRDEQEAIHNACTEGSDPRYILAVEIITTLDREVEVLAAVPPGAADAVQSEAKQDEDSRVDRVPGVGHGDLPREDRNEVISVSKKSHEAKDEDQKEATRQPHVEDDASPRDSETAREPEGAGGSMGRVELALTYFANCRHVLTPNTDEARKHLDVLRRAAVPPGAADAVPPTDPKACLRELIRIGRHVPSDLPFDQIDQWTEARQIEVLARFVAGLPFAPPEGWQPALGPQGITTEWRNGEERPISHRAFAEPVSAADAVPREPQAPQRGKLTVKDLQLASSIVADAAFEARESADFDCVAEAPRLSQLSRDLDIAAFELNRVAPAAPRGQTEPVNVLDSVHLPQTTPTVLHPADELRAIAAELRYVLRYTPTNGPAPIAANKLAAWADRLALLAGKER